MLIDLPNFSQSLDTGHSRHADIHHDGVGPLLLEKFYSRFYAIGGMDLIISFEQHPQAFARTQFIVDYKDLGKIG
jgi:hypothetical protein